MSFRWNTPLKMDETWLNSDREILGRSRQEMGKQGILITVSLPNGEDFQAEVEKLNAESGSAYCNMCREYFDEWKSSKEAASKRSVRDRELRESLVGPEETGVGEPSAGAQPIPQTVEALEEAISSGTSLEEDLVLRLDAADGRASRLRDERDRVLRDLETAEREVAQIRSLLEVINASKVLEQIGGSILVPSEEGQGTYERVDSAARRTEAEPTGSEGAQRGGPSAEVQLEEALSLTTPDPDAEGGGIDHDD